MEIRFDVFFKKNLGTLFKSNEVDLNGKHAHVNIPLALVDRMEVNYLINGNKKYTDDVLITDITENLIQIPFKSDVMKAGVSEFEIIAYMKNGDIKPSQTYVYNLEEGIGEGQQASNGSSSSDGHTHSNLNVLNSITQTKINEWDSKPSVGPQGPKGDKGDAGLTGPAGPQGPQGPAGPAYNDAELRSLIASLTKRVEELENGYVPPAEDEVVEAKSYCGQMAFKSIDAITIEDLEGLVNAVDVVKPQTTYAHSGSTVYNKTLICAIPKSEGVISSVVDGAGVDITASYPILEKTLNGVVYSISCNKVAQAYNKSTVVKFNINQGGW